MDRHMRRIRDRLVTVDENGCHVLMRWNPLCQIMVGRTLQWINAMARKDSGIGSRCLDSRTCVRSGAQMSQAHSADRSRLSDHEGVIGVSFSRGRQLVT